MNRRDWLKRTSLALAGGLVLGNEVMEQYERLTHRKVWALGRGLEHDLVMVDDVEVKVFKSRKVYQGFREADLQRIVRESYIATLDAHDHIYTSVGALNRYARLRT